MFDGQMLHRLVARVESPPCANYDGLQDDAQRRVLVDRCLRSADKERVRYKSSMDQVWEYLDRAYLRQDVFLHDIKGQCHEIFYIQFFFIKTRLPAS